jgi:thiol-disulfide isomerase/thioredoxin
LGLFFDCLRRVDGVENSNLHLNIKQKRIMNSKSFFLGIVGVLVISLIGLKLANRDSGVNRITSHNAGTVAGSSNDSDNRLAPDFSLETLGGGNISLAEYRGVKPVVLDFWASWCHNCRRDMPKLNKMYEQYSDQVEVIGVNLREGESTVSKYINSENISFPIAFDPRGSVSNRYAVQYTNTHVLIDKEGKLVRVVPGDIRESDIKSLIQ